MGLGALTKIVLLNVGDVTYWDGVALKVLYYVCIHMI